MKGKKPKTAMTLSTSLIRTTGMTVKAMLPVVAEAEPSLLTPVPQKAGLPRPTYTDAEQLAFTTEVGGTCPKCGDELFYSKGKRKYKGYEIAHIYPLNPKPEELIALKDEERLSSDVNHFDNLIALCVGCHTQFDKPRTVDGYREMVAIKKSLLEKARQQRVQSEYKLQEDISHVINALDSLVSLPVPADLSYDPKKIEEKLNSTMPLAAKIKIRHNVSIYFQYVRSRFEEIERETPNLTQLIYAQVRTYYLEQALSGQSQYLIFRNVVNWFVAKTSPKSIEAAEIVASYFVQDCEVFQ